MNRYTLVSVVCFVAIFGVLWIAGGTLPSFLVQWYSCVASFLLTIIVSYYSIPLLREKFLNERVDPADKAVVITGCDTGFGHLLAKKLDAEGYIVFASCLNSKGDGATALKESCSSRLHVFDLNVTDDESVQNAVKYVKENIGAAELWALVNNAGIFDGFDVAWTPMEIYKKSIDVNTLGVVRVTQAFLPMLITSKGRVVTITSILGRISFPQFGPYCMSKYAAVCFCETLRQEMSDFGIKVISIEPELFKTPLTDIDAAVQKFYNILEKIPEDLKSLYGETYFKKFKKQVQLNGSFTSSELHLVISSLYDAVSIEEPCPVYKPCRTLFTHFCLRLMENLPKSINDVIMSTYKRITRFPTPKGIKSA